MTLGTQRRRALEYAAHMATCAIRFGVRAGERETKLQMVEIRGCALLGRSRVRGNRHAKNKQDEHQ